MNRFLTAILALLAFGGTQAVAQNDQRPNILVIWGDDVGMWNISAYHRGMQCCETPNIDRIADEGMLFMDHYAQASCTAGRAAFITGQHPLRVGLATVGLPGSPLGLQKEDPTLAEMLKPLGYRTGQFGKNHLGDLDEHLPTAHGFDEFYGILYHLNAGEYPEEDDYPREALEAAGLQQRGIVHSRATGDGGQETEDLGPFGQEVQRTLDEKVLGESKRFIREAAEAGEPFFVWHNTTRMHYRTNLDDHYSGITGTGNVYADGMVELDDDVGELLALLDELGIADNTMVMFSTDNGAASNSWPDGGNQPFRGEKGLGGYEGGFKVPAMVKWPGVIPAGTTTGEMMAMEDWIPTIMARLGQPDVKEQLLEGADIGGTTYRVHLDAQQSQGVLLLHRDHVPRRAVPGMEVSVHQAGQVVQRCPGRTDHAGYHPPRSRSVRALRGSTRFRRMAGEPELGHSAGAVGRQQVRRILRGLPGPAQELRRRHLRHGRKDDVAEFAVKAVQEA
jgi:arylsulfatase